MMDDILAFITARLDEDEAAVNHWEEWEAPLGGIEVREAIGYPSEEYLSIGRARVLRQVAAMRKILRIHRTVPAMFRDGSTRDTCSECANDHQIPHEPCVFKRIIASIYSDHREYREEWAP